MKTEAIAVGVLPRVYLDLAFQMRQSGDLRDPGEVVNQLIKAWLASRTAVPDGHGYQWKELFLPHGTILRMRYRGVWYYADITGDQMTFAGEPVSPRAWTMMLTGTVRNPWRDIWIRRNVNEFWTRADVWRRHDVEPPRSPLTDRRQRTRRNAD